jgi:hypothetical protein
MGKATGVPPRVVRQPREKIRVRLPEPRAPTTTRWSISCRW